MRVAAALLIVAAFAAPAYAAGPVDSRHAPDASSAFHCPRITSYLADKSGIDSGRPLTPKKLTELPPGTAFMAVYRHIGGCDAPLTMVEYRSPRRQ